VQEVLEAEMNEALGAQKGERTEERMGYRSGYYVRNLVTRVGKLELRVPQDRQGRFSTQLFERYQRSEKALVAALAEMYVQGVSTRKVKAITEENFEGDVDAEVKAASPTL
jgi:transposase-like protein